MWKIVFAALAAVFAVGLGAMVGGFRDIDINDAGARDALNFAVVQHNRGSNDLYLSQVSEVVRVQSQVVAGVKYVITVRMGKTPCRKGSAGDDVCAIHEDAAKARPYQCKFTVWSKPWAQEITLVDQKCSVETLGNLQEE
ncbi:cystatin C (amyloid angiopathy and cerebral hemorrhage) [Pagrus major]|uniref:cystatin C (amyloid angiopathy and cerebral hemorrhage) n=1 Tax=Pagrus major TaxID=143350 RepID=UPI003CC8CB92